MDRVSDKITLNEIKKWNCDIITIIAGTGAGKSYFIKSALYQYAKQNNKRILMLIHRRNCVNQFSKEVEKARKTGTIDIMTYQALENLYSEHKQVFDFSLYQYIVCDEFHYFMGDAAFNKSTDISLNMILEQSHTTRIFMSATGDHMKQYINKVKKIETIDYIFPIKYDFIRNLIFFMKDDTMDDFIKEAVVKKTKCIFFIQSAEKAYGLYKKYKDHCLFNCSKSNENYYQYVDEEKVSKMLENQRFEELVLLTTTCLDAGVNIIDTELSYIFVDVEDIGSMLQCIGRKRQQNNDDKINLYIKVMLDL